MNVLVLGAGDFAIEVTELLEEDGHIIAGYAVDVGEQPLVAAESWGKPLWWLPDLVARDLPDTFAVAAIVSPKRESIIRRAALQGFPFMRVIARSVDKSISALAEIGSVVNRGAVLGSYAHVFPHVLVNRGAIIGHHSQVGTFATVGPGANLAGRVRVGARAVVGMGANVREGVTIGDGAVVGMGSVVLEDVPEGEAWWGIPARRVK